ncbi:glycoside hydrolase family 26 protein [Saccharothrix sp. ST-888]|uniref:glycoside hydrolase family 26 protein n=1 Tax=Saccharothrix sp. ST-888 TaxID=1427391 RepID=UPI0006975BB9|nr:glycosyl hydrolase [Saccharothrix sp. ST-888]
MIRSALAARGLPYRNRRAVALAVVAPLLLAACSTGGGGTTAAPTSAAAGPTASPSAPPYDASALRRPGGRLFGVASDGTVGDLAPVTAFAAKAERQPDIREYYQEWGDDFDPAGNTKLWHNGQVPMLSWVPEQAPLARIASGGEDAYLVRFAQQVRSYQGPLVISFAPEMNGGWTAWGPGHATPADFVSAWRHIHDVFREQATTNVIWVWTPHVGDSGTPAALRPYYPGDDYLDWVGLIGYYGPQDGSDYRTLFTPTIRTVRSFSGKPLLIAETGVAEGPRKVAQIDDLFGGAAASDGLIGLVWYDLRRQWPGSKQPTDWRVDSSAASVAEVVKQAAQQKFGFRIAP